MGLAGLHPERATESRPRGPKVPVLTARTCSKSPFVSTGRAAEFYQKVLRADASRAFAWELKGLGCRRMSLGQRSQLFFPFKSAEQA